jgi:CheY-like chemotaxis protein
LTEILGVLRAEQPTGVQLVHQPGASGATIHADRRLLELAVTELVRHACWTVRGGGLVTVLTGLRPADAPADGPPAAPAPPWVTVEVRDTGPGLDHVARERVLEPFLPGRPDAAPMGLAMVRGIVAQHHGHLEVASRPGDGMAIRMVIPARFADPWQPTLVAPDPSRSRTILLVDDDPDVRSYCQRILQSGGYAVTSCADGAEALAVIAGGEAVDAVVLDWALPGLDGRRVREQILRRQPRLPLLVISGHASKDYEALGGIDGDTPWLAKPFTPPALLDAVARLLPSAAEAPGS